MERKHVSVLYEESIRLLDVKPDGIYVDATMGGAGHSAYIAGKLSAGGRLYAFDKDDVAIEESAKKLDPVKDRVTVIKSDFRYMKEQLASRGVSGVDGILFDLGVSSFQLDEAERGFSYMQDAELDMRMDRGQSLSAKDLVNTMSYEELREIFYTYGEERFAPAIASLIVKTREDHEITTTGELADICRTAMGAAARKEKQHPAKRVFQALRIAVNDELGALREALDKAVDLLNPNGRILVITFHSLEDRIVKQSFAAYAKGCTCPPDFPVCVCGKKPTLKLLGSKPVVPSNEELEANPRARSAKLRTAMKL